MAFLRRTKCINITFASCKGKPKTAWISHARIPRWHGRHAMRSVLPRRWRPRNVQPSQGPKSSLLARLATASSLATAYGVLMTDASCALADKNPETIGLVDRSWPRMLRHCEKLFWKICKPFAVRRANHCLNLGLIINIRVCENWSYTKRCLSRGLRHVGGYRHVLGHVCSSCLATQIRKLSCQLADKPSSQLLIHSNTAI